MTIRNGWLAAMAALWFSMSGCGGSQQPGTPERPARSEAGQSPASSEGEPISRQLIRVRPPAVAGLFYPADADRLAAQLDRLLAEAKPEGAGHLRALICPHAGYKFSGPVAAWGYKLLAGRRFSTVVVLAPSHTADFRGVSIPQVDGYRTPLGDIPLSPKARQLAQREPFSAQVACRVQRPQWASYSAATPATGEETPHTWEHSLEVQLPFLQRTLGQFQLIPAVFGRVDPQRAAAALAPLIDGETLIVASSDLSHYHPYDEARKLDLACVEAICRLDCDAMRNQEACGQLPILTVMYLAKQNGWQAKLLDYRNSGDTSGDRSAVVGYAAIAFFATDDEHRGTTETDEAEAGTAKVEPAAPDRAGKAARGESDSPDAATHAGTLSPQERRVLLELAKRAVHEAVTSGKLPEVDPGDLPERLKQPRACFVTLTKRGELRGCIGTIFPQEPLYEAVLRRARSAALEDPRFPPVTPEELHDLEIEISVLTVPEKLPWRTPEELLKKLRPGIDGVVLRVGTRQATFLPQVWEKLPDGEQFLGRLAEKAGLAHTAWRNPAATVMTYQVEAFSDSE